MYKKILVPIDAGRPTNAARLCKAVKGLATADTQIRLLSVAPGYGMSVVASFFPPDAQEQAMLQLRASLEELAKEYLEGEDFSIVVRDGKRAKEILDEAREWEPDLITVASRRKASRDGQRVLGSCSSSVSDRANCSVLVVR